MGKAASVIVMALAVSGVALYEAWVYAASMRDQEGGTLPPASSRSPLQSDDTVASDDGKTASDGAGIDPGDGKGPDDEDQANRSIDGPVDERNDLGQDGGIPDEIELVEGPTEDEDAVSEEGPAENAVDENRTGENGGGGNGTTGNGTQGNGTGPNGTQDDDDAAGNDSTPGVGGVPIFDLLEGLPMILLGSASSEALRLFTRTESKEQGWLPLDAHPRPQGQRFSPEMRSASRARHRDHRPSRSREIHRRGGRKRGGRPGRAHG
jgi:hypothetical protein